MRKLGVVGRVALQQLGRSRVVAAVGQAAQTTARSLGRVLHQLWLEVTGSIFLTLAVVGGAKFVSEYGKLQAGKTSPGRVVLAACFCLTFAYFGVSSFWRVWRKG